MCELLLRGPQTPGELRTHASRLCPLSDVCEVEEVLGAGGMDLARPKAIRAIFWASMLRHQPGATVQDAGDLIGALGLEEAGRVVAEAMNRSGLAGGDGEAAANPPKASRAASISRKR
jgi:hypothetical protein